MHSVVESTVCFRLVQDNEMSYVLIEPPSVFGLDCIFTRMTLVNEPGIIVEAGKSVVMTGVAEGNLPIAF
jgi:hypothetical protein